MDKKYRTKVKLDTRPVGQLAYEKNRRAEGLNKSLNYKQQEIEAWLKLNKQS